MRKHIIIGTVLLAAAFCNAKTCYALELDPRSSEYDYWNVVMMPEFTRYLKTITPGSERSRRRHGQYTVRIEDVGRCNKMRVTPSTTQGTFNVECR